jgi:adenine-specific DNA glycosylase
MGAVSEPLIQWFELNRRLLPFRQEPSAYHIWVSEIMLQQTRVSAALPYYERFVAELPDPAALAACDPDKLRKLWQGLGYYSRVANFPQIMPPCALCPALGITRLGLLPPLHLASQPRR